MAFPSFLSTLPKAARLFYPIAQKGVAQGLSGNAILQAYRTAGPGIRRTVGLEVVRAVRGVERKASIFKALKMDVFPDPRKLPTALTDTLRDYSYRIGYQGVTSEGKSFSSYVTVSTNELISRRQAEDVALGYIEDMPAEYGIESISRVGLDGILKSPRLG